MRTVWIADLTVCGSGHVLAGENIREVPAVECGRGHLMPVAANYCGMCGVGNPEHKAGKR